MEKLPELMAKMNNHYELLVFGIYCKGNLEIGWEDCLKFVEF